MNEIRCLLCCLFLKGNLHTDTYILNFAFFLLTYSDRICQIHFILTFSNLISVPPLFVIPFTWSEVTNQAFLVFVLTMWNSYLEAGFTYDTFHLCFCGDVVSN